MYQDIMDTIGFVEKYDSEVGQAMDKELKRQQRNLELIASENNVFRDILLHIYWLKCCPLQP